MVTSLPTDQEVSGTIPVSDMGIFFSVELFHGICGLDVTVNFLHDLTRAVVEGAP